MKYVGSKSRIAKEIVPIIQKYIDDNNLEIFIDAFVGGGNIIDKIKCKKKIGFDNNEYLIALLNELKIRALNNTLNEIPDEFSEEIYNFCKQFPNLFKPFAIGLIGFSSFGAKWFGGYPRAYKADGVTPRNMVNEAIKNMKKQAPKLTDCSFVARDYRLSALYIKPQKTLLYLDPPYKNTLSYKNSKNFNYEEYYEWIREIGKNCIVICSEYSMPNDFKCIWEKPIKCNVDTKAKNRTERIEKLFIYSEEIE